MTEEDKDKLLEACRAEPVMKIGSHWTGDRQENANRAWQALGAKMGFQWDTVEPVAAKGMRFFTAVPTETQDERKLREAQEIEKQRTAEMARLEGEIAERQEQLDKLRNA